MGKNTITLLLLKEGFNESNAFKGIRSKEYEGKSTDKYLKDRGIKKFPIEGGVLYYRKSKASFPKWDSFFKKALSKDTSSGNPFKTGGLLSAVYFVEINVPEEVVPTRTFALTFGSGRYFLDPQSIETKFGLHTTMSVIDPQAIKSAGVNTIDAVPLVSKTQATKSIGLPRIGFDTDTDVLKSIKGLISGEDINIYGKNLQGSDSLQITTEESYDTIADSLLHIYKEFKSERYKEKFKGFMNIFYVENPDLRSELNDKLFALLNSEDCKTVERIWLDIPEIIDSNILYFGTSKNGNEYDSLDFEIIMKELREKKLPIDKNTFITRQIYGFDDHGNKRKQWSLYQCLIAEIDHNGKKYALNDRDWHEIDGDFLKRVEEFYHEIQIADIDFIENKDSLLKNYQKLFPDSADKKKNKKEAAYNYYLKEAKKSDRILCDAKNIAVAGHSSVEFCDVYTISKQLIHVKRYKGQSAPLSHLFSQGQTSAQLLKNHDKFRKLVNDRFLKGTDFSLLDEKRIEASEYEIIFGIIQAKSDLIKEDENRYRPTLPFFSKINLMKTIQTLRSIGYNVSIAGIPCLCSDNPVKTEEEKAEEKRKKAELRKAERETKKK